IYLECGSWAGYEQALIYSLLTSSVYAKENLSFLTRLYLKRKKFNNHQVRFLKNIFKNLVNLQKIIKKNNYM
ncbi:MAG: hypothetical protein LBU68_02045, partial [Rickettsiales bacterium]|nr:hypothetical protein [Rickettsiales bacterium]